MNPVETVAAVLVLVSVYLSTRENIWAWPTAIVAVALYAVVFWQTRLYAAVGLQACFLMISVYGWYNWLYGGAERTVLRVTRLTRGVALSALAVWAVGSTGLWYLLARHTDAVLPWLDSPVSVASLLAQWMLSRKILENWLIWVAANLCYIGMYWYLELWPTVVLYLVLLVLASKGYLDWRRSWRHTLGTPGAPLER